MTEFKSEISEDYELLFFDTFAQTEISEGPNLGLVQFENPIVINEIRVIPLGTRVEANFPGGSRLGATNPSSFELQFFINDLTRRNACTFLDIGSLDYKQNVNTKFVPKEAIPTDGLILRGMYSTLTLSVFGYIADISSIIANDPLSQSSEVISESIEKTESTVDVIEETQTERIESHSITENISIVKIDEMKVNQIIKTLTEKSEDFVKRRSPTIPQKSDNHESRASSLSSDFSDLKKKERTSEKVSQSRHRSKERGQRHKRSPISSTHLKHKSRSRSKSKSRSTTPNSLKRYRYSHRTPSSPYERSPKRHQKSPRRHRSRTPSPRSPLYSRKAVSRSPLSPRIVSRPRSRSVTPKSPVMPIASSCESNEGIETIELEPKPTVDNLTFDDSELFEPLSPEDSLSDIAEKISDDENLDQILDEEDRFDNQSKDDFEEISSEEEYENDGNVDNDLLMDYSDFELSAYIDFGAFNPFQCEFTSLQTLKDPSLSVYETTETLDSDYESKLKELITSFGDQRNEKWIEGIEQISLDVFKNHIKDESIVKTLIDFVFYGIDFDLAMKQTNTAYKVRHLKAGIKLSIALSQTSEEILKQLIDLNIIHGLLELYSKPYMTIPVRLLIIRAIDVICDSHLGVQHLITHKYKWFQNEDQCSESEQTCYQRLLDILVEKPSTRVVVSLTNLLNKIHFYEVLKYLSKDFHQNNETLNEESIAVSLNEITFMYKNANNLMSQPFLRSLPATKLFEVKASPFDSYKAIYRYFKRHRIIDCLTNIISGKTDLSADLLDSVLELLISMSYSGHGLRFLLSSDSIDSTNNLYKVLIQQCDDSESQIQSAALKLIYRLQVLQLIDLIFAFHSSQEKSKTQTKDNFDDPDLVATLHSLYTMLFTGIGRDAVVQVLSSENNFDSILPFIYVSGEPKKETLIFKSVSCGCALELCLVTLQLIDTNLMSFLDTYGQTLLKVCENESIPKVESLSNWLTPIKNVCYNVFNENTFKSLMSVIKKHYELNGEVADNYSLFTISPELITTLRILQNLCSPTDGTSFEGDNQLKHRYALIQIYSLDGLTQLVFLLNKLCQTYLKPSHQSSALIGNQGSLVVNFIKPSVLIIKSILSYLVVSRATDFKDVSPIPVLLRVYSVLSLVPSTASQLLNASVAQQIQYEICEILLIYTELNISSTESDEAVNKSVWTKMTKHLIDYILSSPLALIHGLTLFSDVLPQTLPLIVKQPLLSHEVIKTVNFRKLWSLHLHVLSDRIQELVSNLITSNTPSVQMLLKRVCSQLCDLSAPTVNIIAKSIFESLLSSLETFTYSTNDSKGVVICPTVRILNLIQDISTNTPFRLGFVSHLNNSFKKEDKNSYVLSRLQKVLNNSVQIDSNESLNFILQPNSDSDVLTSDGLEIKSENLNETNNSENVVNYFANRPVFVLEDDQTVAEWLSVGNEDSDQMDLSDALKIDLLDLSVKYFGNEFDVRSNLEKLWSEPMNEIQTKENDISEKSNILPFIRAGPKEPITLNKRIQAPRGRGRAFTRINDPFRSRPPNTSRPPSMHVDDFVALERNDPNPKRVNKEFIRPNRGLNAPLRSFGANQRSSNVGNYRPSPSSARNPNDRYNTRDMHSLSNRMNKSDTNFPLRWNRLNDNRNDFRYPQYSRSFPR